MLWRLSGRATNPDSESGKNIWGFPKIKPDRAMSRQAQCLSLLGLQQIITDGMTSPRNVSHSSQAWMSKVRGASEVQWGSPSYSVLIGPSLVAAQREKEAKEVSCLVLCFFFFFFFFCLFFLTAIPMAFGSSQARGRTETAAVASTTMTATSDLSHIFDLHHSSLQCGSLTHWARPGS